MNVDDLLKKHKMVLLYEDGVYTTVHINKLFSLMSTIKSNQLSDLLPFVVTEISNDWVQIQFNPAGQTYINVHGKGTYHDFDFKTLVTYVNGL